jgi:hypothetical protein
MTRKALAAAACLLAAAAQAVAQETAMPLAGWSFAPGELGSRPGGLGGAFAAVADDVKAAVANPAGLTQIPLRELGASSGERWAGFAMAPRRVRLSGYATRFDTNGGSGWVREGGLALALHATSRLRLGAALALGELRARDASLAADDTALRFTAGALFDLVGGGGRLFPPLRLGLTYASGSDWSVAGSSGAAITVRRPTVVALGLAARPSERWTVSLQSDLVRYREVEDALVRSLGEAAAAGFRIDDALNPRLGAEYAAALWCGCGMVRARAGVHRLAPGRLEYAGADPGLRAAFPDAPRRTVATLGGSYHTEHFGNALRLDLDARDLFDGPELSFGGVWRF